MLLNCGAGKNFLRVPWTARRSNQSILKEINPEYSLEGLGLKLKLPILWPPDVKSWLIGKGTDAGKDWGQKGKEEAEDEMVGWHHWFNGYEFRWTPAAAWGHSVQRNWEPERQQMGLIMLYEHRSTLEPDLRRTQINSHIPLVCYPNLISKIADFHWIPLNL